MFEYIKTWYERKFSDPHSVTLLFLLLVSVALLYFFGSLIVPVLVALVIAYLLDWPVVHLERLGLRRFTATVIVMLIFTGIMLTLILVIGPVLWKQTSNLVQETPHMLEQGKSYLVALPEQYPSLINADQVQGIVATVGHFKCLSGAVNVISGATTFSLDIRSIDDALRDETLKLIIDELKGIAETRRIQMDITPTHLSLIHI